MKYWEKIIKKAVFKYKTPFYLFSWRKVENAINEIEKINSKIPIKHWYSFKTNPVRKFLIQWKKLGNGIEVVSEYEFLAAISMNYKPEMILINGVAKHEWLKKYKKKYIKVNFDSITEIKKLAPYAVKYKWCVGLRIHVNTERDPDEPKFSTQFGLSKNEVTEALKYFKKYNLNVSIIHFHLRSNVTSPREYEKALKDMAKICRKHGINPLYVDIGGGLPVKYEWSTYPSIKHLNYSPKQLTSVLNKVNTLFPSAKETWMENGRFFSARSAVLVLRVIDIKIRDDSRYLICNGGRTNNALVSDWELHKYFLIPLRTGKKTFTTVCGPTCMSYDRLLRTSLPKDINIGDYFIWMNAGAYHIPWETRFSKGLISILWQSRNGRIKILRKEENFREWWKKLN